MADAPDLGSGSERIGGSSPLARTIIAMDYSIGEESRPCTKEGDEVEVSDPTLGTLIVHSPCSRANSCHTVVPAKRLMDERISQAQSEGMDEAVHEQMLASRREQAEEEMEEAES